jgi:phage/plasmid-associated DNA primase
MVRPTNEQKQINEEAEEQAKLHLKKFKEMFNIDTLNDKYSEDLKEYINNNPLLKRIDKLKIEDFGICKRDIKINITKTFHRSINYIKNNIFRSNKGTFYVLSQNSESDIMPIEYDSATFNSTYLNLFDPILRDFVLKVYTDVYYVTCDIKEAKIFTKDISGEKINYINLFNGFPFDGEKFDENIYNSRIDDINYFLNHIKEVLCSNNESYYNEVCNWFYALIGGKRKMHTALYLIGNQGTGKGLFCELLIALVGENNCCRISDAKKFFSEFNGFMAGKLIVYIDDMSLTESEYKMYYEKMKTSITSDYCTYRFLYKDAIDLKNLSSFIQTFNRNVLMMSREEGNDRRHIILDILSKLKGDYHFTKLLKLKEDKEFLKCFYWHCVNNYDENYNEHLSIKKLEFSNTKKNILIKSTPQLIKFLKNFISRTDIITDENHIDKDGNFRIKPKDLYECYKGWFKDEGIKQDKIMESTHFKHSIRNYAISLVTSKFNGKEKTTWFVINIDNFKHYLKENNYIDDFDNFDDVITDEYRLKQIQEERKRLDEEEKILFNKILGSKLNSKSDIKSSNKYTINLRKTNFKPQISKQTINTDDINIEVEEESEKQIKQVKEENDDDLIKVKCKTKARNNKPSVEVELYESKKLNKQYQDVNKFIVDFF